jgi:cytoskeletal protein CcmA (bactofilin family)
MSFFNSISKAGAAKRRSATASESGVTILSSGCHFNGKLFCKGSSRIGGKIEGEVISEGMLIIEEGAVIDADVKAEEVILHGRFSGKLVASLKVECSERSVFDGELQTPSLLIMEGAQFNGQIKMATQDKSNFVGIDELQKKKFASALSVSFRRLNA